MAGALIGPARCPFCRGRARLTLAKTGLPVLTCNACNVQAFARSDQSDRAFRDLLIDEAAAPAPVTSSAPAPAPAAPAPTPTPAPPPAPRRMGWGLLGDSE